MTADDLSAPLGQEPVRRRRFSVRVPHVIAAALAIVLGAFVVWAIVGDNPLGGEPTMIASVNPHVAAAQNKSDADAQGPAGPNGVARNEAPASPPPMVSSAAPAPPTPANTITIINGKTGARQEVPIPDKGEANPPADGAPASAAATEQRFSEMTSQGAIPKIAADGARPADVFARPVKPLAGNPDAPRIALVVSGLGVSASATSDAVAKLPGAVTLAFMPYGNNLARLIAQARGEGHEVLLQVPMEPFGYPDNDPGPRTLLTSLTPEQNLERLYWLMSRFQGYVGLTAAMGARFTASEQAFAPILRETAKRGLIFVDDGANPRSVAGRVAGADNLPFAKADLVIDAVPTPEEIDHALGRLEMVARQHGIAVGLSSALPVSIEHIAKWAQAAESHGMQLVPITAVALKAKPS